LLEGCLCLRHRISMQQLFEATPLFVEIGA
jgi:hypothetical protein